MKIEGDLKHYLDHALNEARLTEFEYDDVLNKATAIFETVALNSDGSVPEDSRVIFHFLNLSRLSAFVKLGMWDNESAEILKLTPREFTSYLKSFNGQSMYGWEFINVKDSENNFREWKDKASFDIVISPQSDSTNCIDIFSEHFSDKPKTIDLRLCFDDIKIESISGIPMTIQDFIDRGVRGWDSIYSGNNEMTNKYGIVAAGPTTSDSSKTQQTTIWTRFKKWLTD